MMNWKEQLRLLEKARQWDEAIAFMQKVIEDNPNDMEPYIFIMYLLVNCLSELEYDSKKDGERWALARKYFKESYPKFSENAAYLYLMGSIATLGRWLFDISEEEQDMMFAKAMVIDPDNLLYKEPYSRRKPYRNYIYYKQETESDRIHYRKMLLRNNNPVAQQLKEYGALGSYLLKQKREAAETALLSMMELKNNYDVEKNTA